MGTLARNGSTSVSSKPMLCDDTQPNLNISRLVIDRVHIDVKILIILALWYLSQTSTILFLFIECPTNIKIGSFMVF